MSFAKINFNKLYELLSPIYTAFLIYLSELSHCLTALTVCRCFKQL